jgi:hypothetical protein
MSSTIKRAVEQLIERVGEQRSPRDTPPQGDLRKGPVLRSVLLLLLERHVEGLAEKIPQPSMHYNPVDQRMFSIGPAPRPLDPLKDLTAYSLAHLIVLGDELYGEQEDVEAEDLEELDQEEEHLQEHAETLREEN